jgi:hypothetical protein
MYLSSGGPRLLKIEGQIEKKKNCEGKTKKIKKLEDKILILIFYFVKKKKIWGKIWGLGGQGSP